jgi:putative OPT family oligopeptide transporter
VSGLGILAVVAAASILALWVKPLVGEAGSQTLIAFAIFLTAVVFSVATISNDNLQDLKTGQLVEATPWAQQAALVVGVLAGSLVIPPILSILNQAYGFTGAPGAGPHPLNAPQAVLISTLAKNFITGQVQWDTLGMGLVLGVALIAFDELLGKLGWMRIPPLAVALGIYLPPGTISPIVLGAILGHLYEQGVKKKAWGEQAQRLGVIMASGLIVGESLFSVGLAAVIAAAKTGLIQVKDSDFPMGLVGDAFGDQGMTLAAGAFAVVTAGLYVWIGGLAKPKSA